MESDPYASPQPLCLLRSLLIIFIKLAYGLGDFAASQRGKEPTYPKVL
jgi:hypothetical protein